MSIMSPFQQDLSPTGPKITPKTMSSAGQGGQQNPSYLQMRRPVSGPMDANGMMSKTAPVITPKPQVQGDTVNPTPNTPMPTQTTSMSMQPGSSPGMNGPQITPASNGSGLPPQAGGSNLGDLYKFFASDLENQTKQAKSNAVADASARGVYYGTPLTGSEADIDTQYLRGMGQLQAGMYGNEQQNQLARLGMATNLSAQGALNAPPTPGGMDWSGLGALFANNSGGTNAPGTDKRTGPVITPPVVKSGEGAKPAKVTSN